MKRKNKNCMERKKRTFRKYSNNINLFECKFFKKQRTNTLYCFANRSRLDESSNSMD